RWRAGEICGGRGGQPQSNRIKKSAASGGRAHSTRSINAAQQYAVASPTQRKNSGNSRGILAAFIRAGGGSRARPNSQSHHFIYGPERVFQMASARAVGKVIALSRFG